MFDEDVMRRSAVAISIVVAALPTAVTALAGGGERERIKLNAADQAAARATMIRRADLPRFGAWKGGPVKPDHTPYACPNFDPKQSDLVVTGAAMNRWSRPDRLVVSATNVLQNARMVRLDWQRTVSKAGVACAMKTLLNISVSRIAFPKLAPMAAGFRVFYDVKWNGQTFRQVVEMAAVGRGRSAITVSEFMSAEAPPRLLHSEVVRLVRIALSRARA